MTFHQASVCVGCGGSEPPCRMPCMSHRLKRERVTVAGLVPTAIRMLLPELRKASGRCDSLRRIIVATEAFPVPLNQELLALLPRAEIHSVFGSTEALVTNLSHAEQFTHPASVGRPIPGVEVVQRGISVEDIAIAVARNDQALLARLTVAQAELEDDGTLQRIRRKWLGNPYADQSLAVH